MPGACWAWRLDDVCARRRERERKQARARGDYARTILFGDCPLKTNAKNREIQERLEIPGCPPPVFKAYPALIRFLQPPLPAFRQVAKNLFLSGLTHAGLYRWRFSFFDEMTRSPEFDQLDFYRK